MQNNKIVWTEFLTNKILKNKIKKYTKKSKKLRVKKITLIRE
jgi:hypothetical protein